MGSLVAWWLAVQIIGLVALPLTFRLFRGLSDRGYALARPLGLLLAGYLFWLASSLGLLRNDLGGVIAALVVLAGISVYVGRREIGLVPSRGDDSPSLWQFVRENKGLVIGIEVLFLVSLALWAWYRSYSPEIATAGGEKFMEYAFINAIMRSPSMPPHDPWLSGFAISYYYFGYVIISMLIRLTGLASSVAFNLSLALLFALTVTGSFCLVYNLVRQGQRRAGVGTASQAAGYGLLGSIFLAVVGNLQGFLELLHARGLGSPRFWTWLDIRDLTGGAATASGLPERFLWWWRASRVLQDRDLAGNPIEIINEFPFFSFMLGDVHPHVLALPFALLMLGLALNLLTTPDVQGLLQLRRLSPYLLLFAVCLGGMAFLNTWDFPIYLGIVILALGIRNYMHGAESDGKQGEEKKAGNMNWLLETAKSAILLALLGGVLYLPFYLGFQSQAGGPAPALWAKTKPQHYLVMFGMFVFIIVSMLVAVTGREWSRLRSLVGWRNGSLLILGAGALLVLLCVVTGRWLGLSIAILITMGAYLIWHMIRAEESQPPDVGSIFALLVISVGLAMTFLVEFVYIRDMFNNRMNTIFKFYYQAWVLMAIGGGFGVYYLLARVRSSGRYVFGVGLSFLLAAGMVYPILAATARADDFQRKPTLDGIAYAQVYHPADYAATRWLKDNVSGEAVVLEANGPSYTFYGRVSAFSGIPTLLGWGGHQLQWRGNYDEPGRREPHIEEMYRSMDVGLVQALLEMYDVTHVYVGWLEREKFRLSQPMIEKFGVFMDLVYHGDDVLIYERRGI